MDYAKHYDLLIQKRRLHAPIGYSENHDIVPRSWGGGDDPTNELSAVSKWVKGRIWIRKDNTKMIDKKDLSGYLSEGWFLGRGKLSRG